MGYEQYGISKTLVQRVRKKMKNRSVRDKVTKVLEGVSKSDLQNRNKIKELLRRCTVIVGEKLDERQEANIVRFVMAQKIDPGNTLHLIRLWSMFR